MPERLQKLMARAGLGSRRQNELLIAEGRVRVNGRVARLGDRADPNNDLVEVDDRPLQYEQAIYIKLNKPKGVLSSTEDELESGRPTVRDLVPETGHIYPVGRLDRQSEGLMLLTNDGALTHRMTHPRYGHEKVYQVVVERGISERKLERWRKGIMLDGRRTAPAIVELTSQGKGESCLRITLREGRKRQIRRVAAALGHPVKRLSRERIGPIELGGLKPGEWEYLTEEEVGRLMESAYG